MTAISTLAVHIFANSLCLSETEWSYVIIDGHVESCIHVDTTLFQSCYPDVYTVTSVNTALFQRCIHVVSMSRHNALSNVDSTLCAREILII